MTHRADFRATFDHSGGRRTGPYAEALALAESIAQRWPEAVTLHPYGKTPEGRTMLALAVGRGDLRAAGRPVLFFQAGIHPGEIEGKDAGFRVLVELLEERRLPGCLDQLTLLFIPALNADGHERSTANNRPNQRGPEEMGWRTTAQNLNLNRDYTKIDAPEMAQVLRLMQEWDPVLFCDIHATDGAQFEHDVSLLIDCAAVAPAPLRQQGEALQVALMAQLTAQGHQPVSFYPSLRQGDDPASGFDLWVLAPRYSNGYWGTMRQRLSVLVETHSWRPYDYRVQTVEHILHGLIALALQHGKAWLAATQAADVAACALGGSQVPLTYDVSSKHRPLAFAGYAYTRTQSPVSGRLRTQYDESKPETWTVPYYDELQPACTVTAPKGGYVVPAAYAALMAPKLMLHGISFEVLTAERASHLPPTWTFRPTSFTFAAEPFEGRTRLSATGAWQQEAWPAGGGSLFVPIAQARARLVLHLFEPTAPDSFLAWGFFNGHFERKEHMEGYVAEAEAEVMLKDPAVAAAFAAKLATDPAFAASGDQRLDWFYRRHPSWDQAYALYPIIRLEAVP